MRFARHQWRIRGWARTHERRLERARCAKKVRTRCSRTPATSARRRASATTAAAPSARECIERRRVACETREARSRAARRCAGARRGRAAVRSRICGQARASFDGCGGTAELLDERLRVERRLPAREVRPRVVNVEKERERERCGETGNGLLSAVRSVSRARRMIEKNQRVSARRARRGMRAAAATAVQGE